MREKKTHTHNILNNLTLTTDNSPYQRVFCFSFVIYLFVKIVFKRANARFSRLNLVQLLNPVSQKMNLQNKKKENVLD